MCIRATHCQIYQTKNMLRLQFEQELELKLQFQSQGWMVSDRNKFWDTIPTVDNCELIDSDSEQEDDCDLDKGNESVIASMLHEVCTVEPSEMLYQKV